MPFEIGDQVWHARNETEHVREACDTCYGKLKVTLILGNGDQIELPCKACAPGYEPPKGYHLVDKYVAKPVLITIDRVDSCLVNGVVVREYRAECYILKEFDVFTTREGAEARAKQIASEHEVEERKRHEHIKKEQHRSYSWNAAYHRREAKKLREKIEYHERNAVLCKERSKDPVPGSKDPVPVKDIEL